MAKDEKYTATVPDADEVAEKRASREPYSETHEWGPLKGEHNTIPDRLDGATFQQVQIRVPEPEEFGDDVEAAEEYLLGAVHAFGTGEPAVENILGALYSMQGERRLSDQKTVKLPNGEWQDTGIGAEETQLILDAQEWRQPRRASAKGSATQRAKKAEARADTLEQNLRETIEALREAGLDEKADEMEEQLAALGA